MWTPPAGLGGARISDNISRETDPTKPTGLVTK